jgi:hypothetical protein
LTAAEIIALLAALAPAERRAVVVAAVLMEGEGKAMPAAPDDELLDANQAAAMLGVSRSKLYHTRFDFVVKVGGSRRYSRNGMQKYIERKQGRA